MGGAVIRLVAVVAGVAACGSCARAPAPTGDGSVAQATPVRVAQVTRETLEVTVSGPGRTEATEKQKVRAPFDGTVLTLPVADGDHVSGGEVVGTMASRNSLAALEGARDMLRSARTRQQRADARRALTIARRNLVTAKLRAPEAGIILSHRVDEGSQVNANNEIMTIVATDSLVFVAQVAQSDLTRVHPGQHAAIALSALARTVHGVVYAILPGGSATDLTTPVRIDFVQGEVPNALNLFGTAAITVAERRNAVTVPAAALLRNDITGITWVATVTANARVHWVVVKTGVSAHGRVEIVAPMLAVGQRVIVAGQVGLPEGSRVRVES